MSRYGAVQYTNLPPSKWSANAQCSLAWNCHLTIFIPRHLAGGMPFQRSLKKSALAPWAVFACHKLLTAVHFLVGRLRMFSLNSQTHSNAVAITIWKVTSQVSPAVLSKLVELPVVAGSGVWSAFAMHTLAPTLPSAYAPLHCHDATQQQHNSNPTATGNLH